jgi:ABC-type lipoprotein export system ATPase subunit
MSEPRLQAIGLTKHFTRRGQLVRVVDDLDLTVAPGELVAVTGPSLTGKTTLIELLAGWRRPDQGSVTWDGGATRPPPWPSLTVVPQALALVEEITVVENIGLARRVRRVRRVRPDRRANGGRRARRANRDTPDAGDDRLAELLDRLGLTHLQSRGAYEISVGERQRAMVARALLDRPGIVLADEPVAHQDQHHADLVLGLLREAVDQGAAGVIATRQPDVAQLADRVLVLAAAR